jgi:hypothetical protein
VLEIPTIPDAVSVKEPQVTAANELVGPQLMLVGELVTVPTVPVPVKV